jgi:hypothetical protein
MAYSYSDILNAQFQNIDAAQATAAAELEAARHAEDPHRVNSAAEAILHLDLQRNALAQRAQGYSAHQQHHAQQPANKFGLTEEERSVAHAALVDRKDLPPVSLEEREEIYARNKHRMRQMIANGTYSRQSEG